MIATVKTIEKRKEIINTIIPYLALTGLMLALLFLPMEKGDFFGSEGDWYSQHVGAAESIRQTMLEQGTLFPQYINIGGGINAYDLAYYGLLRPDVMISCLLPGISMKYIIAGYAVLGVVVSVNLCFAWLKRKGMSIGFAMAGAVMTATATCFFHSHHQIMFVNYMPFMFTAFIGIDTFLQKKKSFLLMLSIFLICIHSFFYAPTCLVVLAMYFVHCVLKTENEKKLLLGAKATVSALLSVGMAAVLLLPTALDILSTEKDGGSFADEPIPLLDLTSEGLLHSAYGVGLTLIALYGLLLALYDKRKRGISAAVLICCLVPAIWLVFSGFLYARSKMLIPFLPLIAWICSDVFENVYRGKQKLKLIPALMCVIPAFYSQWRLLILVEWALLMLWILIDFIIKKDNYKAKQRQTVAAMSFMMAISVCVSYGVNTFGEEYIKSDDMRQSRFELDEIDKIIGDKGYRFDYLTNSYLNSNLLPSGDIKKTAMYSSVTNTGYSEFFYDIMKNPIVARNRVALAASSNIFFNYFMGIRYVLVDEDRIPYGYETIAERDGYVIAENKNVLPVCYGVYSLVSEAELDKLEFPDNIQALTGSRISPIEAELSGSKIKLAQIPEQKTVIISFDIERSDDREVSITIDGIKNKLSSESAAYPNKNYNFTYVLTSDEKTKEFELEESGGDYEIKNLRVYEAGPPEVEHVMPVSYWDLDSNQVFCGSVDMEQDGYFVTSMPYKEGYRAEADGKEVKVEKVNTTFAGFPLEAGEHDIEITYCAPGFWAGTAISLLSFGIAIIVNKKEKNLIKRGRRKRV